ncbi:dual specificity protein kinase shkA-like [Oppia nitens]|uniref:dual specificity protein kinase shkA-like n=1 Tax=Oppia nitens TaxID=1686743 RepID=UPI0023D9AAE2|nr:dual specificity protein kinase shkA-like [Oppia nitens]
MPIADASLYDLITMIKLLYYKNLENNRQSIENHPILQLYHWFIACELFKEIAQGVNYLHTQSPVILHLDLKPRNILIRLSEPSTIVCKICDFGLAVHENTVHLAATGGTPAYMAPEGIASGVKADIYSLGVVLRNLFDNFVANEDSMSSHSVNVGIKPLTVLDDKINSLKQLQNNMTHGVYTVRPSIQQVIECQHRWDSTHLAKRLAINSRTINISFGTVVRMAATSHQSLSSLSKQQQHVYRMSLTTCQSLYDRKTFR